MVMRPPFRPLIVSSRVDNLNYSDELEDQRNHLIILQIELFVSVVEEHPARSVHAATVGNDYARYMHNLHDRHSAFSIENEGACSSVGSYSQLSEEVLYEAIDQHLDVLRRFTKRYRDTDDPMPPLTWDVAVHHTMAWADMEAELIWRAEDEDMKTLMSITSTHAVDLSKYNQSAMFNGARKDRPAPLWLHQTQDSDAKVVAGAGSTQGYYTSDPTAYTPVLMPVIVANSAAEKRHFPALDSAPLSPISFARATPSRNFGLPSLM